MIIMAKLKKAGSAGRFGARYGTKTRKIFSRIEKMQRQKKECPYCEREALKRVATGIWACNKCKVKFAGAAYFPSSPVGDAFKRQMKTGILSSDRVGKWE
jgi:large subunit ribosomal protein L37Ae